MSERNWQEDMDLCNAATPPPWEIRHEFNIFSGNRSVATTGGHSSTEDPEGVYQQNVANARFFHGAREALPYWLDVYKGAHDLAHGLLSRLVAVSDENERLQKEVTKLKEHCLAWRQKVDSLTKRT